MSHQLQRACIVAVVACAGFEAGAGVTVIQPDDPGLVYSEFVQADVRAERARFDRLTVDYFANTHSPGTRVSFRSDARRIEVRVDYRENCIDRGGGKSRLEVDGVLQPGEIGQDCQFGVHRYVLYQQETADPHDFSLLLPFYSDVDLLALILAGGTPGLLDPVAERPSFLYVAYGDSITQGVGASDVAATYPYLLAEARDWRVINMGFSGQIVTAADGTAVGELGGDLVTVAIGTNDFWFVTSEAEFKSRYHAFLDNLRALQPDVPVYAITPTWVNYERAWYFGFVEDYRDYIREVVIERQATDSHLYLIEGWDMVVNDRNFFPDGIHPNDEGYAQYAAELGRFDLVRNGSFELDDGPFWSDWGGAAIAGVDALSGRRSIRVGPTAGGAGQQVYGLTSGSCYTLSATSRIDAAAAPGWFGITFEEAEGTPVSQEDVVVLWSESRRAEVTFSAPAAFDQAWVWAWREGTDGFLVLDDVELVHCSLQAVGYDPRDR